MEKERLDHYLKSVGKGCFVKYFESFKTDTIPNSEIVQKMLSENKYTLKSCNSRTGHARMIIRESGAEDALKIILESKKLDNRTKELAKKHLNNL